MKPKLLKKAPHRYKFSKLVSIALLAAFLFTLGCGSDDHEGIFNENSGNPASGSNNGLSTDTTNTDKTIHGVAADIRIQETSIVYMINRTGDLSSSIAVTNGSFTLPAISQSYPLLLVWVQTNQGSAQWSSSVQSKIVFQQPTTKSTTLQEPKTSEFTLAYRVDINPFTTAITELLFREQSFSWSDFAEKIIQGNQEAEVLKAQYVQAMNTFTVDAFNLCKEDIVASWGQSSKGTPYFNASFFDTNNFVSRSSFTQRASFYQIFIESLAAHFGKDHLALQLADYAENKHAHSSTSILDEKGFQEGILATLFSQNYYDNNSTEPVSMKAFFEAVLFQTAPYSDYIDQLQSLLVELLNDTKKPEITEEEVTTQASILLDSQTIQIEP